MNEINMGKMKMCFPITNSFLFLLEPCGKHWFSFKTYRLFHCQSLIFGMKYVDELVPRLSLWLVATQLLKTYIWDRSFRLLLGPPGLN